MQGASPEALTRLARLLGLPAKAYAVEINSRWSRLHATLGLGEFLSTMSAGRPLAVSVSDYLDGVYTHEQAFLAFDVDCAGNVGAAGKAAREIRDSLKIKGLSPGVTYTGKKGFRVWIFLTEAIPDQMAAAFQHDTLVAVGFTRNGSDHYLRGEVDCETLIGSGDGRIVKIPFSRHQDGERAEYFELPVSDGLIDTIYTHPPTDDDWICSLQEFEDWAQTEAEVVALQVEGDWASGSAPVAPQRPRRALSFDFNIPAPSQVVYDIYERIMERPCLKQAFENCSHTYWPRATIALSLAAMGYKIEEAAAFFAKYICDSEDLMNIGELQRQLANYYPSVKNCMCRVFQDRSSSHYCCPGPCGRARPTDMEPPRKLEIPEPTHFDTPEEAEKFFDDIIYRGNNASILGPARSGKTTGIGLSIIKQGFSAVVLVPRISIVTDTWAKILKMATDKGLETKICFIPDNRLSCLKSKKRIKSVREEYDLDDDEKCALEELPYLEKPSCKDCPYHDCVPEEIEPNTLYGEADISASICGYQTVVQNLESWNIVILTNKKFNRIISLSEEEGWSGANYTLLTSRRVFVLDEVSSYFETADADIDIFNKHLPTGTEFRFVDVLKEDLKVVKAYIDGRIESMPFRTDGMREVIAHRHDRFGEATKAVLKDINENYKIVIDDPEKNVFVFKRDVTLDEIEDVRKALSLAQGIAERKAMVDNVALLHIYDLIALGGEMEWIFSNDPTIAYAPRVSIKIAPKTIGYINCITGSRSQIITLDITPSLIPMGNFFGVAFDSYNLGDRAGIYANTIIIPDSKHINASDVLKSPNFNRLIEFIKKVVVKEGQEISGLLFPSIDAEQMVMKAVAPIYPNVDARHHRGSLTMGVHCDRRVAVSICAPFAPKKSLHWLKTGAYAELLADVSHTQLWFHQQAKESMQGEARYIDPEGKARSVVYAYGQTKRDIERTYLNAIVRPRILNIQQRESDPSVRIAQGHIWRKHGVIIELSDDLMVIRGILDGKSDQTIHESLRQGIHKSLADIARLRALLI